MKLKKSLHILLVATFGASLFAQPVVYALDETTVSTEDTTTSTEEVTTSLEETTTSVEDTTTSTEEVTTSLEETTTSVEDTTTSTEDTTVSSTEDSTSTSSSSSTTTTKKSATKPSTKKVKLKEEDEKAKIAAELKDADIDAALEAIIGKDDQYRVKNTKVAPYRSVVHLYMDYNGEGYVGSGVMISPDLVLTVAHNVFDKEGYRWANSVTVTPAKNGSFEPFGRYYSNQYYIFRNYKAVSFQESFNFDIAVLKLNRPVPSSVGQLPVSKSISVGQRLQIPGYPAYTQSKRGIMHTAFGTVDDYTNMQIGHMVDTEGGNSGSPILNAKNQVIGVHTGGRYTVKPYGVYNFGRRVDQSTLNLIAHARRGSAPTITVSTNKERLTGSVYRLYNPKTKQYFYTKNLDEANRVRLNGWKYEGRSFVTASSGKPVYRLYHSGRKTHVFTTNKQEIQSATRSGWRNEGIAWYSGGSKKIYRLFNPSAKIHMYTSNVREVNILKARGWKFEGVVFNAQ